MADKEYNTQTKMNPYDMIRFNSGRMISKVSYNKAINDFIHQFNKEHKNKLKQ